MERSYPVDSWNGSSPKLQIDCLEQRRLLVREPAGLDKSQTQVGLATLPWFAEKFAQLGWFCSDKYNIHPSNGNVKSNSLIIPINYFAYKETETGVSSQTLAMGTVGTDYI